MNRGLPAFGTRSASIGCTGTKIGKPVLRAGLLLVVVPLCLAACTYEKTVYWRPALSSIPDAVSGGEAFSEKPKGYRDPTELVDRRIRIEQEEGDPVLVARTARHLMAHIYQTLQKDERDLFTSQVLCEATRQEFRDRDMDPGEAFDYLKDTHMGNIAQLFARMPNGEYTPNVTTRVLPGGATRVSLSREAAGDLLWRGFDMIWEGGHMETVGEELQPEPVYVPTLEEAVAETGSISNAIALIEQAEASKPQTRFVQSGWKLRWFVQTGS